MADYEFVDQEDSDVEMFQTIGTFVYAFSQLELAIRLRLSDALELKEDLREVVVGPYDLATLCNVTKEVLIRTRKDLDAGLISKLFNRCHALNQKARIVVAHGTWFSEGGGASHFSKNSFTSTSHFTDLNDLRKQIDEARNLMWHVVGSTGWKYNIQEISPKAKIPPL
jgi:hypothetical protein